MLLVCELNPLQESYAMLIADYHLSPAGEIISNEIPRLCDDESIRLVRTSYKGEESLLVEIVNGSGTVGDQIMFRGLQAGRLSFELVA